MKKLERDSLKLEQLPRKSSVIKRRLIPAYCCDTFSRTVTTGLSIQLMPLRHLAGFRLPHSPVSKSSCTKELKNKIYKIRVNACSHFYCPLVSAPWTSLLFCLATAFKHLMDQGSTDSTCSKLMHLTHLILKFTV